MNLFDLHTSGRTLDMYADADAFVPEVFYERYSGAALAARETAIARCHSYSLRYATDQQRNLNPERRFRLGEPIIATSPSHSVEYAEWIGEPFPLGEPSIVLDDISSVRYAQRVLKGRFPAYEAKLIADINCYVDDPAAIVATVNAGFITMRLSTRLQRYVDRCVKDRWFEGEPHIFVKAGDVFRHPRLISAYLTALRICTAVTGCQIAKLAADFDLSTIPVSAPELQGK